MRSFHRAVLLVALAGATLAAAPLPAPPVSDPPAVLGEPYAVDGATVTPVDAPFDDVGLAALDAGAAISMAHRTLPLPSYAEVTALDSGRTILVRVERRGPLAGPAFVALSAGAFTQLAAESSAPLGVRVRRVSPQEYERSLLRTGQRAPERLATPKPLLEVLRRRLADKTVPPKPVVATIEPVEMPPSPPPPAAKPAPARPSPEKLAPPKPATGARPSGSFAVQVAAFASRASADATAKKLYGSVSAAGKLWRVRLGPFATRADAGDAQARARKAGFADAQLVAAAK